MWFLLGIGAAVVVALVVLCIFKHEAIGRFLLFHNDKQD